MLAGMSIREFQEWRAYADLEPFDEERADLRAASVVFAIYNAIPRKKGSPPPQSFEDCVLRFGPEPKRTPEQARAQVKSAMMTLMKIHNKPKRAGNKK